MTPPTSFGGLLQALAGENGQFILVGGLAGVAHGSDPSQWFEFYIDHIAGRY
jgi:hypothetical protein